jgi:hypothetical protein
MTRSVKLAKAELRQLDAKFKEQINPDQNVQVQFNPESLKVSYANQLQTSQGTGDQKGSPARQFVGAGTTKLSLTLWFDVTAEQPAGGNQVNDVRKLTQKVAYFITPSPPEKPDGAYIPPSVRFIWGSFKFDGLMDSLEESLEFFSNDGRPLRASVTINISQQKITEFAFGESNSAGSPVSPGTRRLTEAPAGANLPAIAASLGKGNQWQSIAAANNIENPRQLQPGQLINMNSGRRG